MALKSFSGSLPVELKHIKKQMYKAKFEKAQKLIGRFEKRGKNVSKEDLSWLVLKGKIYCYQGRYKLAIDVGEFIYQLSQKLGCITESVDALLIKAHIVYLGRIDEAFNFIIEAEKLFKSLINLPSSEYSRLQSEILLLRSIISRYKDDQSVALDSANQCLELLEQSGEKLDLSRNYYILGEIYLYRSDPNIGLNYAFKSLQLQQELGNQVGIARSLYLVGVSYYTKGDFEQALRLGKQSLMIEEISILTKLENFTLLALIYKNKGELDRAIRYRNRAVKLAKEEDYVEEVIINFYGMGEIYRTKGDLDQAEELFKQSLELSQKYSSLYGMHTSLFYLILTNLDFNNLEKAKVYLTQLEQFSKQTESKVFNNIYLLAKALILKKSGRIRNRTEAELLLKKITEREIETPLLYLLSLVNLCELFLEELTYTNNPEVLDELNPLINKIFLIAEKQNLYSWLVETKLLQAKLALIQMNFDVAQQLLTQAQKIAELHGFSLLALKISSEHDKLLEQINEWGSLKISNAPMSERIKLASFNGVVDRMKGKRALEMPKIIPEDPVLLLIIGEGGFPLFSNPFKEKLFFEEDLISAFLAAFNSFSSKLFSKGLDRAKFGDYIILMQTINTFSICYLFKGQTYSARQKLNKFTGHVRSTTSIWETLNNFYRTNRVVELKDLPPLESLITDIFIR